MFPDDKRTEILFKAHALYVSTGKTLNITEALRMYLEHDAGPDEQIPLFVTSPETHQVELVLQQVRPLCDDCDAELHLQVNAKDPAGKSYPTAWVCKNCAIVYYSDKTATEWLEELRVEARKQNLRKPDKPVSSVVPPGQQAP